ncbi:uncharacterized protein GWK60_J02717 [Nakaseomyces glabratus]|nr:CBM21 (carbohydrate binding type-21) domain profile [Nakaseomyces glabratus]QNG14992.1 uncharacterized protein GWK60_J02717 [Nakaseomyces glabratus]
MTYIRAGAVPLQEKSPREKHTANVYAGKMNGAIVGGSGKLTSLQFLHKPQRVSQLNKDRFPEEELLRNTQLNKNLHQVDSNYREYSQGPGDGGASERQQARDDLIPLSPKSTLPELDTNMLDNTLDSDNSSNDLAPFSPPVYKKSGEPVKSVLKRRSKSLPGTPGLNTSMHGARPPNKLMRSKSVHFDQTAPVRYFNENERPIDVSNADIYQQYGAYLNEYGIEDRRKAGRAGGLSAMMQEMSLDDKTKERLRALELESKRVDEGYDSTIAAGGQGNAGPKLRKSKRFHAIKKKDKDNENNKENLSNPNSTPSSANSSSTSLRDMGTAANQGNTPYSNYRTDSGASVSNGGSMFNGSYSGKQQQRVVGLYNENFPILSNKNPKSLKLNIFINLSQGKEVFLQELSLHIHRERAFYSPGSGVDIGTPINTRLLSGRVLVKNIFFDKRVLIRYTWDRWRNVQDVEGVWVSSAQGLVPGGAAMDVFHFVIDDATKWEGKASLEFCIQYTTRDDTQRLEFWDNNCGKNYCVDLVMDGFRNPFANALK